MTAVIYTVLLISQNYTATKNQTCSGNFELFIEDRLESRDDISNHCSNGNKSQEYQTCKLKYSFSPERLDIDLECVCYLTKHGKKRQYCDPLKTVILYYIIGILGAIFCFCICRIGPHLLCGRRSSSTNTNRNTDNELPVAATDNVDQIRLNELTRSTSHRNADQIGSIGIENEDITTDEDSFSAYLYEQPPTITMDRELNLPTYETAIESPPSYEVATVHIKRT